MEDFKRSVMSYIDKDQGNMNHYRNQITNKDIIILLGITRSGKSTLTNYLIDDDLEAFKNDKDFKIRKTDLTSSGATIEHGSTSCTTTCSIHEMRGMPNVYVIDSPGFEDTRSNEQDILNAYYINQLKHAKTVKFVAVFDINDLTRDNVRGFTKTIEYMQTLVANFNQIRNAFGFIFMKDRKEYTPEELSSLLRSKIVNVQHLRFNKTLVENVCNNSNRIGSLRMPTRVGPLSSEIDVDVRGAIRNIQAVALYNCSITPSVSDETQNILLKLYGECTQNAYFESKINKLLRPQDCYFRIDKYVFASYDSELTDTKNVLTDITQRFKEICYRRPNSLSSVQNTLQSLFRGILKVSLDFNDFKFFVLLDECGLIKADVREKIISNYVNVLELKLNPINTLITKIKAEQATRTEHGIEFGLGLLGSLGGLFLSARSLLGGALAVGVGIGVALYSFSAYQERMEARKEQGRP